MKQDVESQWVRNITTALGLVITLILIACLALQSYRTVVLFDRVITPELGQKAGAVARTIGGQIERLVSAGNPLPRLNGLSDFVRQISQPHPEIVRVMVLGSDHSPLFFLQLNETRQIIDVEAPITVAGAEVGRLVVGYDALVARKAFTDILYDILTTLLVSSLLAFELILVVITTSIAEPSRQLARVLSEGRNGRFLTLTARHGMGDLRRLSSSVNRAVLDLSRQYQMICDSARMLGSRLPAEAAARIEALRGYLDHSGNPRPVLGAIAEDIRLPLFVFFLSTELSRSFMPLFADQLYEPILGLPRDIAITLPISGYMAMSALATPYAGTLVDRFGVRRVFLGGLVPSAIAYVMVALATTLSELILWRCIGAAGAAGVTIAALGHIARYSKSTGRAAGMAIYTGTFVAAGVCGASIGGIIADRLGFAATFAISAGLAVLSGGIIWHLLDSTADQQASARVMTRLSDVFRVMKRPAFAVLVLGVAIPAGVITMGHLFFATPLLLSALGETQSAIGRYIMLYFLVMILLSQFAATAADRTSSHYGFLGIGILSMAAAPLIVCLSSEPWAIALSVAAVGVGNAFCAPAQGAVLLEISHDEAGAGVQHTVFIAVFRVLERVGLVLGPMVAAALAAQFGTIESARMLGWYTLLCAIAFIGSSAAWGKLLVFHHTRTQP